MKVAHYLQSFHAVGLTGFSEVKFEAGKAYPLTEESERHIGQGIAEARDVDEDPAKADAVASAAEAKAEKAEAGAESARARADEARALADAAAAAQAAAAEGTDTATEEAAG
jgi:hypothetical protein